VESQSSEAIAKEAYQRGYEAATNAHALREEARIQREPGEEAREEVRLQREPRESDGGDYRVYVRDIRFV
jgi:hypothetical protein